MIDETELAKWIGGRGVAVLPVLTKADKLAKHERLPAVERARRALATKERALLVSGTEGDGISDLLRRILAHV
jgi:GTP-binding protein EngB required for normal cell division